jgi:hypothetical protein
MYGIERPLGRDAVPVEIPKRSVEPDADEAMDMLGAQLEIY